MAIALGGLATPPSMLSGALVKKKLHLLCFSHNFANASKSQNSPIGVPQNANKKLWSTSPLTWPKKGTNSSMDPMVGRSQKREHLTRRPQSDASTSISHSLPSPRLQGTHDMMFLSDAPRE